MMMKMYRLIEYHSMNLLTHMRTFIPQIITKLLESWPKSPAIKNVKINQKQSFI